MPDTAPPDRIVVLPSPEAIALGWNRMRRWIGFRQDDAQRFNVTHAVEFVRSDAALAWFKDRHLTWCRGEDRDTPIGFDEWIEQQWAAAGREADQ